MPTTTENRQWLRPVLAVLAAILAVAGGAASPAQGVGTTDVTGDVTDPTLVSFTVSPASGDVTAADASFSVSARVTDDLSGVESVGLYWTAPGKQNWAHGIGITRTGGDASDGTWTGTFAIPRYSPPGDYGLHLSIGDRVGNGRHFEPEDLRAAGFTGTIAIEDRNADATPPAASAVRISPLVVDTRTAPGTVQVEIDATDSQSGVYGIVVFLHAPDGTGGGAGSPFMALTSGSADAGTWTGTATLPKYTPQGRWELEVRIFDHIHNQREYSARDLAAAGLPSAFDVVSDEDDHPPQFASVSVNPFEVNVHEADQTVIVRVRVTDDRAGVQHYPWGNWHNVQIFAYDRLSQQGKGLGAMTRTSGTAMDGVYEGSFVIPKSSATGLRPVQLYAQDEVANYGSLSGADLVAAGGPIALLVYNVPLPPLPIDAIPADTAAIVRWDPPVDDRGAAVTGYVIRESPGGAVVEAPADARSAEIRGLSNGVSHTFTVTAVNRAGASDASTPVSATPYRPTPGPSPVAESLRQSGYWMVDASGAVHAFGAARGLGNAPVGRTPAVDIEPTPSGSGYWVVDSAGGVFAFGDASYLGGARSLVPGEEVTSLSSTPGGRGYWLFTTRGRVLTFGDAPFLGDMAATRLNGPVLDSVPTPSGRGYYMVAADGGVFSFGDARFAGSMGAAALNAPVQSLVPDGDGSGYWLVASDGGIFAFDAPFSGSMGATPLNRPVTGMVGSTSRDGYLMVAEDGGIFTFGDVAFHGSLGGSPPPAPVVAVAGLR